MKPFHVITPLLDSRPLSHKTGQQVFLKMECNQPTGSFKIRGIGRLCQKFAKDGCTHLVASSGGNAGNAVAYAGRKLGIPVTVFVPKKTNPIYLRQLELQGAIVRMEGDIWDEAHQAAMEFLPTVNGGYVHPFDHPVLWEGHATMIDEMVTQGEKPDAIVASVGGGGLMCGILQGLQLNGWSDVATFAVETEGAASFAACVKSGEWVTLPTVNTIASTLAAKRVTKRLFDWSQERTITSLVVSDKQAVDACRQFADDHRVLVEPACGAALAVLYDFAKELRDYKNIVVIICGGVGISMNLLQDYMQRFKLVD